MNALVQRARALACEPAFAAGMRDMLTTVPGLGAWALVTGVATVKAGLPLPLALFMSVTVYAGTAQLSVLPLMVAGAPLWMVWFTALCVNLRFLVLSALWRNYFDHLSLRHRLTLGYMSGDVLFVLFMRRYPTKEKQADQLPYFWGMAFMNWLGWQIPATAGIFLANVIPMEWGLGFAGVLAILGVLYAMLKGVATWVAAAVSAAAAVAAFGLPLRLNTLVAIATAVVVGLVIETVQKKGAHHGY